MDQLLSNQIAAKNFVKLIIYILVINNNVVQEVSNLHSVVLVLLLFLVNVVSGFIGGNFNKDFEFVYEE